MNDPQLNLEAMVNQYLDDNPGGGDDDVASMSFEDTDGPGQSSSSFINNTASSSTASNSFMPSSSTANNTSNRDIFYCENYFDLKDILSQSNRLSVSFQRAIPKLGFLDPGAEDDRLLKGTKLGK